MENLNSDNEFLKALQEKGEKVFIDRGAAGKKPAASGKQQRAITGGRKCTTD
jgi:hypothetical protein